MKNLKDMLNESLAESIIGNSSIGIFAKIKNLILTAKSKKKILQNYKNCGMPHG